MGPFGQVPLLQMVHFLTLDLQLELVSSPEIVVVYGSFASSLEEISLVLI
jgi:hypothetical protein